MSYGLIPNIKYLIHGPAEHPMLIKRNNNGTYFVYFGFSLKKYAMIIIGKPNMIAITSSTNYLLIAKVIIAAASVIIIR